MLFIMAAAVPISFATWQTLLNNFSIESASFTGSEIGLLQSLREIPGLLAIAVVFLLALMKEQFIAIVSLVFLGIGTAITGFFPSIVGLYATTLLMSFGYHYYETIQTSLSLQWIDKKHAPETLGKIIAVGAVMSILTFILIWTAFEIFELDFKYVYLIGGVITIAIALYVWISFPTFPIGVKQHQKMIFRKRYWLYYVLTFLSGARRQIFVVFAGFLMVEKFHYSVEQISILFLVNAILNMLCASHIGKFINYVGERFALICEYTGLIIIFIAYALVENSQIAAVLYIIDHLFFALAIAIKTYFQKIADPADMASTAGVSFTINHVASVFLPALLGVVWLTSPSAVFIIGAFLAGASLLFSLNIPTNPSKINSSIIGNKLKKISLRN